MKRIKVNGQKMVDIGTLLHITIIYGKRKQYVSKKYISKLEAEQEELLFLAKRENHSLVKFSVVAMDYFKYMYQIRKESSIYSYENAYKNNIAPYFENLYINNINIQNINFWRLEMTKKGFKLNYLNKLYTLSVSLFSSYRFCYKKLWPKRKSCPFSRKV